MTPTWQSAALALVTDLRSVFGDRLQSVVVYGAHADGASSHPVTCLALVDRVGLADLESCARHTARWHKAGLATPLLLPESEFRTSLDAFPLEYGEIMRSHQRVFGDDPFAGVTIGREDLRRECETQIKSHLLHLREGFLEAKGDPAAIGDVVAGSAAAFTALLRHVAWLTGADTTDRVQATREGAKAAGVADTIVADMLALENHTAMRTSDPARVFPEYLAAVEQLARTVDAWRV